MTFAARVGDFTAHGGAITGPGIPNVLIGGSPAAVAANAAADVHTCGVPVHGATPFTVGSATVFIAGWPALRAGDLAACGAPIASGMPTVYIGG